MIETALGCSAHLKAVYNTSMTPKQKDQALYLIRTGKKLESVRYLQGELLINSDQALRLAEKLEEETGDKELRDKLYELREKRANQPRDKTPQVVGVSFMVIGLILLAMAGYIARSNYQFAQHAISTKGIVVGFDSYDSSDDDGGSTTMYSPVYEYEFNGVKYTYLSTTGSSSIDYDIGVEVEILVDPDHPTEVLVESFMEQWLAVSILTFLGLMFTGLGFMAYRLFK
ncbi:MAG: DUF3592 domain-containing protein [Cyclobacteriaceae bacterium]